MKCHDITCLHILLRSEGALGESEAAYAAAFAPALKKVATTLGDGFNPPETACRASARLAALSGCTPWLRANADVCEFLIKQIAHDLENQGFTLGSQVADLSQSGSRAPISVHGVWGTLTTSSKLFDFVTGKWLSSRGHMALMGFTTDHIDTSALSDSDLQSLAGNAMNICQVAKVLFPILRHKGCFE